MCPTWVFTVASDRCSRRGDLRVGRALGDLQQHLPLPVGELVERVRVRRPAPAGPAANRSSSRRVVDGATTASPRCTVRIASSRSSGRASLSRKPLAPARSAAKAYSSRSKVVSTTTRAPADRGGHEPPGRLHPVQSRHPNVHQHHVGGGARRAPQRVPAVVGLADHPHVGLGVEHHPEPGAHQLLVVDQEHPDHRRLSGTGRLTGSRASTAKPPPGRGPAVRLTRRTRRPARASPADPGPAPGRPAGRPADPSSVTATTHAASSVQPSPTRRRVAGPACLSAFVSDSCTSR